MLKTISSTIAALTLDLTEASDPKPDPFSFVVVSQGSFQMGGAENDRFVTSVELPQRSVRIDRPFALGRSPVTVGDWQRFRPSQAARSDIAFLPMVNVSWTDAIA
ncbi:MAG: SUMF1/EgtB/PvdO family nonheme iron enzyme, partial [Verrucomicrobiota bacterium]